MDENHLADINEMTRENIFKKSSSVLIEFGSAEDDEKFKQSMVHNRGIEEAPRYVANYIWNERLFGMKTKRLGPSILASEVIMPISTTPQFIEKAKKKGGYFGVEICIDCYIINSKQALVMATFLCDSRKMKYYINLPMVAMLTKVLASVGAKPYGLGLWNSGLVNYRYNREEQHDFKAFKARVDPNNILNPGKSFSNGPKRISAMIMSPGIFSPAVNLFIWTSPVIGKAATMIFGKNSKVDNLDLELSTHACAKCGNCMAVSPSYLVTKNEGVTAKGKIALAKKLLNDKAVSREEGIAAFQCMHCKACEQVCQTNLELIRSCRDVLEKKLEGQIGRPEAQIDEFLKKVNAGKENRATW